MFVLPSLTALSYNLRTYDTFCCNHYTTMCQQCLRYRAREEAKSHTKISKTKSGKPLRRRDCIRAATFGWILCDDRSNGACYVQVITTTTAAVLPSCKRNVYVLSDTTLLSLAPLNVLQLQKQGKETHGKHGQIQSIWGPPK